MDKPKEKYSIQVLERAISMMDLLLEARRPLNLETITARLQLPKATAFRLVSNLIRHGYVCQTDDGYWLGLKMISFGHAVEERFDIQAVSRPFLESLRDRSDETVYLATLTHDWKVLYLDKYPSRQPVGVTLHAVGMVIDTYCTGLGKALTAFRTEAEIHAWLEATALTLRTTNTLTTPQAILRELEAIRQRGYSVDNGERTLDIRCIAAPIRNASGQVIAAISVAGPTDRMPNPLIGSQLAGMALETAHQISMALGLPSR